MAGKGRPITNFSNYWHEDGLMILEAAAVRVLSRMDPFHAGFVEKGELVVEGFWRSFRYCKGDEQLKYQFLHAVRHMQVAYVKIRYEQSGTKNPLHPTVLPDSPEDDPYICPHSRVGFMAVDLIDEMRAAERTDDAI